MIRMLNVVACFGALAAPAIAAADRVPGPPDTCPPGSEPRTGHGGPHCAPTTDCASDADCSAGHCAAVDQCIQTRACGGRRRPTTEPDTCTIQHVIGPCGAARACDLGAECRARRVCVFGSTGTPTFEPPPSPTQPPPAQEAPPAQPGPAIEQGGGQPPPAAAADADDGGCSVGRSKVSSAALPLLGVLLGLAVVALGRRRARGGR